MALLTLKFQNRRKKTQKSHYLR